MNRANENNLFLIRLGFPVICYGTEPEDLRRHMDHYKADECGVLVNGEDVQITFHGSSPECSVAFSGSDDSKFIWTLSKEGKVSVSYTPWNGIIERHTSEGVEKLGQIPCLKKKKLEIKINFDLPFLIT